jgi:hypothetical protein
MKKVFLKIVFLTLTFLSCDPPRYYDYYVTNNCNKNIEVTVIGHRFHNGYHNNTLITQIAPNTTQLVCSGEDYQPLNIVYAIHVVLENIVITNGNVTSKINYIDKDLWDFNKTSKDHANSYLTITPKDFEDE